MSRVPRLRQRCGRPDPAAGQVERRAEDLLLNELLDAARGGDEEINRAVLSGLIAEEPLRDRSRDGDPVTVLLVSLAPPDERTPSGSCCCEIEVPDPVADPHRRRLRPGGRVLVVGQLTGPGALWANAILAWR